MSGKRILDEIEWAAVRLGLAEPTCGAILDSDGAFVLWERDVPEPARSAIFGS